MEESLITPEAKAMEGKEIGRKTAPVLLKEAQRFAAAANDLNPLYFDEEVAKAAGYRGIIAPPMFLPQVTQGVTRLDTLLPDGIASMPGANLPLRAERRMAGGEAYEFLAPLYPGDTLTAVTVIGSIEEKAGRSGPFVLVTLETVYTDQDGATVAKGRFTLIAR